jgi:hypothetical protein
MSGSSIRASRTSGTATGEVDRGAELAPRRRVEYWCADDHLSAPAFALDAELPLEWECDVCGGPAVIERGAASPAEREPAFHRTPYEFLMMRRTPEDGERLLAEALEKLRSTKR